MDRRRMAWVGVPLGLGVVGIGVVAAGAPAWLGSKLQGVVQEQLDAHLDADVRFEPPSVTVWSSFPTVRAEVAELTVTGRGAFAGVPLVHAGQVAVAVDVWSLIGGGAVKIEGLRLADAQIHAIVDAEGRSNLDIVKSSGEATAEASPWAVSLSDVVLERVDVAYDDAPGDRHVSLRGIGHRSSGTASDAGVAFDTATTIDAVNLTLGGVNLARDVKVSADVAFARDAAGAITLGDVKVALNALVLGLRGKIVPEGDDTRLDLAFDTQDTSFATLLSLLPTAYQGPIADVKTAGTLALSGTTTGRMSADGTTLPGFHLNLGVTDASFQYPSLPASVDGIGVDVTIDHAEGPADLAVVTVPKFTFRAAESHFDGHGSLRTPVSDPDLDLTLDADLDLAGLGRAVPLDGQALTGRLIANADVGGKVSAFEAGDVGAIRASGRARGSDLHLSWASYPGVDFQVAALDVSLADDAAALDALTVRFGGSDVSVTGKLDNLVPYAVAGKPLRGELALRSSRLDTGDLGDAPAEEAPASEDVLVAVPTDLDLTVAIDIGHLTASGWDADDVRGGVRIHDGTLTFDALTFGVMGGRVGLDGDYAAKRVDDAALDLKLDLTQFDVATVAKGFPTLTRLAPLVQTATGAFDARLSWRSKVGRDGTPDLASLTSKGKVISRGIAVKPPTLTAIAGALGGKALDGAHLDGSELLYDLLDGKMTVKPTALKLGATPTTLSGVVGVLDETVDLGLDLVLPTAGLPAPLGAGAVGDVPIRVSVVGPWADPKVKAEAGAVKAAIVDAVKEKASEAAAALIAAAEAQGDLLVAEAAKGAARLRDEAAKGAKALRAEAKKQGAKLVADAKDPIAKKAATVAAEKLNTEADKKAKLLVKTADDKAAALEKGAADKKAALVAEAKAKAAKELE